MEQTACRLTCTHCRSVAEANACRLALYAQSFACWIKRRVVRAYQTTCCSDKWETTRRLSCFRTTCRPCEANDLSFELVEADSFGSRRPVVRRNFFKKKQQPALSSSFVHGFFKPTSPLSLLLSLTSGHLSGVSLFPVDR